MFLLPLGMGLVQPPELLLQVAPSAAGEGDEAPLQPAAIHGIRQQKRNHASPRTNRRAGHGKRVQSQRARHHR